MAATAECHVGRLAVTGFSEDAQTPPMRSPALHIPLPAYLTEFSSRPLVSAVAVCQNGETREKVRKRYGSIQNCIFKKQNSGERKKGVEHLKVRERAKNTDMEECDTVKGERRVIAREKHKHTIHSTYEARSNKKISSKKKTNDGEISKVGGAR